MDDAERNAAGTAIRRANKGPADAVIRQATEAEVDAAFADTGGERGPALELPGANKIGGPGGKGSTAGIRTGSKEAGGGLDVKAAENLRIRRERAAAAAGNAPARVPVPPAKAPASEAPLEPWETLPESPKTAAPAPQDRPQAEAPATRRDYYRDFDPADRLAVAQMDALAVLGALPEGFELYVSGGGLDPQGVALVMGLGFLIGKRYAVYRGDSHYRLSAEGREAIKRGEHQHA